MDNGKHPQVKEWTKKDNVYTLNITMKENIKLQFTHMLNYDGKVSDLQVFAGGKQVRPITE